MTATGSRRGAWRRWRPVATAAVAAALAAALSIRPADVRTLSPRGAGDGDGAVGGGAPGLAWDVLASLDVGTGRMGAVLARHAGTPVRVPGYIVPLAHDAAGVTEFLLVPFVGACVHVPPPPANQMVHVRLRPGRGVAMRWWEPVSVTGVLRVERTSSPFGAVGFSMVGASVAGFET